MLQSLCLCPGTGHELPGLGAVAGLLSGTDAGSFPDVSELAGAAPAACLWTSVMAWPSATSFWTSLLASHFISGWQTLLGSRRPASSHTESIGSATRHKANTAYSRESAQYQHCFEFVQIYIVFRTKRRRVSPSCCPSGNSPLEMKLLIFFRIFLWDLDGWNFSAWHLDKERW